MDLSNFIEKARKNLKKSSISNYVRNINILHDKKPYDNLDFLKNHKEIESKLEGKKDTSLRNYYTSIVVALNSVDSEKYEKIIEIYQNILKELTTKINDTYAKNEKTVKENNNWLTYAELQQIQVDYQEKVNKLELTKKEVISPKDNKLLLYYLIASLYTLHAPLRLDWANMKYIHNKKDINYDDNFILDSGKYSKTIYLNDFKNVKKIGKQSFKLNKDLVKIINLYRKFNKGEYFLMNTRNFKMSQNSLSKMIPIVFNKNNKSVNLNMVRKSKIASEIDIEQQKKEVKLANDMLHSEDTQKTIYLKK